MARHLGFLGLIGLWVVLGGCLESKVEKPKKLQSIFKKKTQDIGKFDPNIIQEVSNSEIKMSNPITGPLEAYAPILEQVSKMSVEKVLSLYYAQHERYPDYDEFMSQVVKKNDMWFPVLPAGAKYQYDEKNHKLVVIKPARKAPQKSD
jgi:hypothetical protein